MNVSQEYLSPLFFNCHLYPNQLNESPVLPYLRDSAAILVANLIAGSDLVSLSLSIILLANPRHLYRGARMTLEEIKEYQDNKDQLIRLFGYTSCSLTKDLAMKFMWENKDSGHHMVLFKIIWKLQKNHLATFFINKTQEFNPKLKY